ncbi:MAG TPA: RusA family crossover junction endodeoxyribonuclease [Acidimicrobiales bacterium]|nr:RusA family crossover junction endodeoxyribonuclease [Acidimicrobiales bacterium]
MSQSSTDEFRWQPGNETVELRVWGEPQPQGNKTPVRAKDGRVLLLEGRRPEARRQFRDWREGVRATAIDWANTGDRRCFTGEPVEVRIVLYLTKPKSLPKWRWIPRTRPDVDKLARSVLDGLTGVIFVDDGQVCDLHVLKRYVCDQRPGAIIRVRSMASHERQGRP